MSEHNPDHWVIQKVTIEGKVSYMLVSGWSGSYLGGHSYRISTPIESYEEYVHRFSVGFDGNSEIREIPKVKFITRSRSEYHCTIGMEGVSMANSDGLGRLSSMVANTEGASQENISYEDWKKEYDAAND